jgi:hypothetical protein
MAGAKPSGTAGFDLARRCSHVQPDRYGLADVRARIFADPVYRLDELVPPRLQMESARGIFVARPIASPNARFD